MKLIATIMLVLLPLAAKTAETSTYGQRVVAAVLMGEARGEGEVGMTAVAEVIRNRAREAGKSPLEIVSKRGEFSCLNGKSPEQLYRKFFRMKTYETALRIARTCYNAPDELPNMTKGATYYDQRRNRPPWIGDVRWVASIGNHEFYVLK